MAVGRNLIANSVNQGVAFGVNIIAVPLYLKLLGIEQYALIGLAVVVQTWVNLLEAGMSGTLGREMTRFKAGHADEAGLLSFLRSLDQLFFGAIILLPLLAMAINHSWSAHWFSDSSIPGTVTSQSIVLVVALAAVRLAGNLYRGGLMGLERQVFASWLGIVSSIMRLVAPLPFVAATHDVRVLFAAWLLISLIELVILRVALGTAFTARMRWSHFSLAALRQRTHVWGSIGIVAVIWTIVSQSDKLVLARVLPLSAYGQFTLVMVLSNALLSVPAPIAMAYQPRFTSAAAQLDVPELKRLVDNATRLLVVLAMAPVIAIALMPGIALFAWTGNRQAAAAVSSYAGIYLLGSSLVAPATIMYGIQLAYGNLRLHVRVLTLGAVILIPGVFIVAQHYGAGGAARLWLAINLASFLFYFPVVIRRFLPGDTLRWYFIVALPPLVAATAVAAAARRVRPALQSVDRLEAISTIAATELLSVGAAALIAFLLFRHEQRGAVAEHYARARLSGAGENQ